MRLFINDKITALKTNKYLVTLKHKRPPLIIDNDTSKENTNTDFNRSGMFIYNELEGNDLSPLLQNHQVISSALYNNQLASIIKVDIHLL